VTLTTPGKADVQVAILTDPDGYEICFVNEDGFNDLCSLGPGDDYIDWAERAALGGDGHPLPSLQGEGGALPPLAGSAVLLRPEEISQAAKSTAAADAPTLSDVATSSGRSIVMWAAPWCKYCKRAMPAFVEGSNAISESDSSHSSGSESRR